MKLKNILFALVILSLAGSASLAFAEDNVLQKARQKYDRSASGETPGQKAAKEAVRGPEAPAAETAVADSAEAEPKAAEPAVATEAAEAAEAQPAPDQEGAKPEVAAKHGKDKAKAKEKPATAYKERAVVFQLVPGLPAKNDKDSAALALSPVFVSVGEVRAVEFGLFLSDAQKMSGVQFGGLGNFAGEMNGVELAGLFNIVDGRTDGVQASGLFNIAGDGSGVSTAGLFDITGNYTGVQATGLFNISRDMSGVQASGLFNIGRDVTGVQASGLFNYGKKVKGVQLGLVNISDDMDGLAIGLINYSRTGINEINVWYETNKMLNVSVMTGSKHFYSLIQVGEKVTDLLDNTNSLTAGAGVGFRVGENDGFHFQADLSARTLIDLNSSRTFNVKVEDKSAKGWKTVKTEPTSYINPFAAVFPSLRLGIGYNFDKVIGLFGGITVDVDGGEYWTVPDLYRSPAHLTVTANGNPFTAYAKLYAGIVLH